MGKIVMLVNDDDDVREVLRDFVEDLGYRPVVAANGQEALDVIRGLDEPPCVILLDLMMPVMDGWQFLERVGADAELSGIRDPHQHVCAGPSAARPEGPGQAGQPRGLHGRAEEPVRPRHRAAVVAAPAGYFAFR